MSGVLIITWLSYR